MRLAHIVNPVDLPSTSDLHVAQPITFESMRRARAAATTQVTVEFLTAQYPEDRSLVAEDFKPTPDLTRSVLDLGPGGKRKLPLLGDILLRLVDGSDADYLIYTNVDIALQPTFYDFVVAQAERGLPFFTINRRTLDARWSHPGQLEEMYLQEGEAHPGHDCFVIRRDLLEGLDVGDLGLGAPLVARTLIAALWSRAGSWHCFDQEHLTFHLGNDRVWEETENDEYARHNAVSSLRVHRDLLAMPDHTAERLGFLATGCRLAARLLSKPASEVDAAEPRARIVLLHAEGQVGRRMVRTVEKAAEWSGAGQRTIGTPSTPWATEPLPVLPRGCGDQLVWTDLRQPQPLALLCGGGAVAVASFSATRTDGKRRRRARRRGESSERIEELRRLPNVHELPDATDRSSLVAAAGDAMRFLGVAPSPAVVDHLVDEQLHSVTAEGSRRPGSRRDRSAPQ